MTEKRLKKIMVPTDFSDSSEEAVEYAVFFSRLFEAQLLFLHVLEPVVYELDFSFVHPTGAPDLRERLRDRLRKFVEKAKGEGIRAEGIVITGVPSVEIIKAAKSREVDLIMMGTHGRTGLAHILLGSTAERVIQHAPCPVFTVQAPKKEKDSEDKKKELETHSRLKTDEVASVHPVTFCHLCGLPSKEFICEACTFRIQAEAFERKQKAEKEGRG